MRGLVKKTLAAALLLAASSPAVADGRADQEQDCINDALTWCGQHVFAPDRDLKIGDCLWEHRTQISRACRSHLRPPKRPPPKTIGPFPTPCRDRARFGLVGPIRAAPRLVCAGGPSV